jgi:hypothetical protein
MITICPACLGFYTGYNSAKVPFLELACDDLGFALGWKGDVMFVNSSLIIIGAS